ncbi:hypothetical protein P691DRAFT_786796 [Macrolepiota fuliginosa MF-IS2]|uniref:Uncharacterized protein n=1 Tax=Macrolepiota fuliginosa MF-IS2 TaxID=1400762 RepID=A0A9P5X6Q5_9AGAR|nr:hypothetical protein P691DRAFT_786796 [Macrolepiota fuliginosa MF-IS2]
MLDAFRIKPFDLKPILEDWKDGPVFLGNPKKDPPVEEWLDKIKEGSIQRGVPEEYWYKVAQHFMGPKAKARLDALKEVIRQVHGGKYRWTWKKFRIAVLNMGWNIDKDETQTIKFSAKSAGLWFMRKKDGSDAALTEEPESEPAKKEPSRSGFWPSRKNSVSDTPNGGSPTPPSKDNHQPRSRPQAKRAATEFFSSFSHHKDETPAQRPPPPPKSHSEAVVAIRSHSHPNSRQPSPPRSHTVQPVEVHSPGTSSNNNNEVVSTTQAPVWLLNACNALDFITSEHPKTMSVLSAILITVGSIPAIPAITAGAGGAVLASGAAHAIGAIAVGVGQALSMSLQ